MKKTLYTLSILLISSSLFAYADISNEDGIDPITIQQQEKCPPATSDDAPCIAKTPNSTGVHYSQMIREKINNTNASEVVVSGVTVLNHMGGKANQFFKNGGLQKIIGVVNRVQNSIITIEKTIRSIQASFAEKKTQNNITKKGGENISANSVAVASNIPYSRAEMLGDTPRMVSSFEKERANKDNKDTIAIQQENGEVYYYTRNRR